MTSLGTFDPESLDLDIYVQDVRGLGRGRGFKVVGRRSALDESSVSGPIKDRLLDLSLMLYNSGVLSDKELAKRFGFSLEDYKAMEDGLAAAKADLSETEDELEKMKEERDRARTKLEKADVAYSGKMRELIDLVSDALDETPDEWEVEEEDTLSATLESGLERLIESYQALKASSEEEG